MCIKPKPSPVIYKGEEISYKPFFFDMCCITQQYYTRYSNLDIALYYYKGWLDDNWCSFKITSPRKLCAMKVLTDIVTNRYSARSTIELRTKALI